MAIPASFLKATALFSSQNGGVARDKREERDSRDV
jgi:hypothetical protein